MLDAIVERCAADDSMTEDDAVASDLEQACHQVDEQIVAEAQALAAEMSAAVGQTALCDTWHMRESLVGFPVPSSRT